MKALLIKKTTYAGSYIICALLMEFILFNALDFGSFAQYYWLNLAALIMLALIIFIIPSFTVQSVMILALLFLQAVLGFVNESLNKYSGNIFSIDMLSLGKEVGGAYNSSFVSYPLLLGLFAVFFLEAAVLFILRRFRARQNFRLRCVTTLLAVFCIFQISASSLFNLTIESFASGKVDNEYYVLNSDSYLFDTFHIKQKAYRKFGTFAFYFKNISNVFKEFAPISEEELEQKRQDALTAVNAHFKESEKNSSLTSYTGSMSGNNLIVVMIESGEWYGINEIYTPTLYALANSGIKMDKYYARNKTNHSEALSILGTYPKESVFSNNLFYKNTVANNNFCFSLPAILKNEGYKTTYLHNNFQTFYDRNTLMPSFGFDNAYFLEDMAGLKGSGLMPGHPQKLKFDDLDSDRAMFETNLDRIVPEGNEPFFTFLTTITMHGGYDDLLNYGDYPFDDLSGKAKEDKKEEFSKNCYVKGMEQYYEQINREDYFDSTFDFLAKNGYSKEEIEELYLRYKRYQAAYMDLDKGMEALIKHLDKEGKLDNTTILMYADHGAYFNGLNYTLKATKVGDFYVPAVYNIPFFFYNGSMPITIDSGEEKLVHAGAQHTALEAATISKFTSTFDILPTLLDLYGYKYNTALYHGSSVFSDNAGIFVSMESGFFDDKFFSMDGDELLYPKNYSPAENKQFSDKAVEYIKKQTRFEQMYRYDYFNYADKYGLLKIKDLIVKSV